MHKELGLSFSEIRHKRHLLKKMLFNLITRRPDLVEKPDICREDRINYEIYRQSPYIRGIRLWKLSSKTQHAENKRMFDRLLTDDIIQHLKD